MDNDLRWLVLRDLDVFPPPHHTMIVCQRDMNWEVMAGAKERRHEFVVEIWTGKSFGRLGGGKYLKWSPICPAGMMRSPLKLPSPDKLIIVCSLMPQFFGVKVGRMNYEGVWQLYSDALADWINLPSAYVEGWLPLS